MSRSPTTGTGILMNRANPIRISVIIPTFNSEDTVEDCVVYSPLAYPRILRKIR